MHVQHNKYGTGIAEEPKDGIMKVRFSNGIEKSFLHPSALHKGILKEIKAPETMSVESHSDSNFDKKLDEILRDYILDFNKKKELDFVVKPSIPIVWFGDMDKYLTSTPRILTVGLNPSDQEFSDERFYL